MPIPRPEGNLRGLFGAHWQAAQTANRHSSSLSPPQKSSMESAIPEHLRRPRTRHARISENHRPVGQGVVPRFAASVSRVSIAHLGVQHRPGEDASQVDCAVRWLMDQLALEAGPSLVERSSFVDRAGFHNQLLTSYSTDDVLDRWWQKIGHRWTRDHSLLPGVGRFAEIFQPSVDRVEAIAEGVIWHGLTRLAGRVSEPVLEQGYWGSMRDRIPLSQTDALSPSGAFRCTTEGSLTRVQPPSNLCLIRTGQDWSLGDLEEQQAYRLNIEPTMKASMDLLDGSGPRLGCLSNRYAWVLDGDGRVRQETFGLSLWRSLEQLERWAEGHFNHLASFLGAVRHGQRFGAAARFSRYHEVIVPSAEQVLLEYRNCHETTGLLAAMAASPS